MNKPMNMKRYLLLGTFLIVLYCVCNNLAAVNEVARQILRALSPFFTAITAAYLLNLLMTPYEKILFPKTRRPKLQKLRRPLAITMAFTTVLLVVFLLINFLIPQLAESGSLLFNNIPGYLVSLGTWLTDMAAKYEFVAGLAERFTENWVHWVTNIANTIKNALPQILSQTKSFTGSILNFALGIVLACYLLANKEKFIAGMKKLLYAFLSRHRADRILYVSRMANETFGNFISGQLTEAVILGTLCALGMTILNLPYPLLIGVMIGLTGIIPILGAYLGAIPATLIILMVDPVQALWFMVFLVVLQSIEGNLIYPKVVGKSIGLNGFWVLFALLVGGGLWGVGGMLIGIPAFAVFYDVMGMITEHRLKKRGIAELEPRTRDPLAPAEDPEEGPEEGEKESPAEASSAGDSGA